MSIISGILGLLMIGLILIIPVLVLVLLILRLLKKRCLRLGIATLCCIGSIVPLAIFGALTSPATWCEHEFEVIEEVAPTCNEKGKIVKHCPLCDSETTERLDKLTHNMKEVTRIEPTHNADGKVIRACDRCGYEQTEIIPHTEPESNDTGYINGNFETVEGGTLPDIESDDLVNELMSIGFTETESTTYREVFLKCGIKSIAGAAPTDPNATIDGLVAYRIVLDDDRTVWFTIDRRELFYISLNGVDVYDTSKGGYLISIDDVHIPEKEISESVKTELESRTQLLLEPYFVKALWFNSFAFGRSDNNYVVRCEVYAENRMGFKDTVMAFVYYEHNGTDFDVTAISIDGVRYK